MWQRLAKLVLKYRLIFLLCLFGVTGWMGYLASKVQLSYEFAKAIPVDNPKYQEYLSFKQKFGDDGNLMVIAIQTNKFFELNTFNAFSQLQRDIKKVKAVETVLGVSSAINLLKNNVTMKMTPFQVFHDPEPSQRDLDSDKVHFYSLPFYRTLLYNPDSSAFLIAVRINKDVLNSADRTSVVNNIVKLTDGFTAKTNIQTHLSGLPLIRTLVADRIKNEMKWFLLGSIALSALVLLLFFRSVSTMLLSLTVVVISVIWSFGILELFHYKITLLTALIPPLVVVIGIPNCIYFLNKYHSTYKVTNEKDNSLIQMVSKMGVVTLFCNITAAIGFAVFAFTQSAILKEFGEVAGISIMMIFVISFIFLPACLSYLPTPKERQMKYLDNKLLTALLVNVEKWVVHHKSVVYITTLVVLVFSVMGIFRLKSEGYIVDDLPKSDKIYLDLKFFESNFRGVMPLEIVIDTKRKNGVTTKIVPLLIKMDTLCKYICQWKEMARPLSFAEGLKFAKQALYEGDTASYSVPNAFDLSFLSDYIHLAKDTAAKNDTTNNITKLLSGFIDSSKQRTRISINMADVGTVRLPKIIDAIQQRSSFIFDTSYNLTFTGTSVTFLEGSRFIIDGLKASILWAFLLIALCMLYLFKSVRILFCSLIPNVIPLVVTAGIMGWMGIRLKPSTVLIFSVALGIAIDVTIRFLVNYKQELPANKNDVLKTVSETIRHTGLSILYTSMVLVVFFNIFCFSGFGGTQALGWLTSVTLLVASLTNLVLLPVLLLLNTNKRN